MENTSAGRLGTTLVLWDVDHTLIENGGVSKATYRAAFERIAGWSPEARPVTHGRTDVQIMRELLVANGVTSSEYRTLAQFEEVLRWAMGSLEPELARRGYVLPGVPEALAALAAEPAVLQSTLTGNITDNARIKVTTFGLEKWLDLDIGGYGSDGEVRSELIDASRRKVAEKYGRTFDRESTILVGDTPLDVKAAHDGGAKVIAVASGVHRFDELESCGPDATLPGLADTEVFLATVAAVRAKVRAG